MTPIFRRTVHLGNVGSVCLLLMEPASKNGETLVSSIEKPVGQESIWNYFQNDAPENFAGSRGRLSYLVGRICPGQRVLNIGCGSGILEELAIVKGIEIYALDPTERTIQQLREKLRLGERAKTGYIQHLPFDDEYFDVVVASEVIEHLTPEIMNAGLAEIYRVLRPNGHLLGTVPSRENLKDQMVVCPSCDQRFHRWGHEQRFDANGIQRSLSERFHVREIVERPFITWTALNWKGKVQAALKLMFWRAGIHGSDENIFFVAEKGAPKA